MFLFFYYFFFILDCIIRCCCIRSVCALVKKIMDHQSALLWNIFDVANECVKTPAVSDCWNDLSSGNTGFNNSLKTMCGPLCMKKNSLVKTYKKKLYVYTFTFIHIGYISSVIVYVGKIDVHNFRQVVSDCVLLII